MVEAVQEFFWKVLEKNREVLATMLCSKTTTYNWHQILLLSRHMNVSILQKYLSIHENIYIFVYLQPAKNASLYES